MRGAWPPQGVWRRNQLSRRQVSLNSRTPPTSNPQNDAPTPKKLMPDAETTKVAMTATRSSRVVQAHGERAGETGHESEPGHRFYRHRRRGDDQRGRQRRRQSEQDVGDAARHGVACSAWLGIRMRLRPSGESASDGGETQQSAAADRSRHAQEAGDREQLLHVGLVALRTKHREARKVLRRHGHDEERDRQAGGGAPIPARRRDDEMGPDVRQRAGGKRVTKIVIAAVTSMAIGTAKRRANLRASAQTITIGRTIAGWAATACTGARQISKRMPASMALASEAGIAATSRPNGRICPLATIKAAAAIKAPIAAG